MGVHRAIDITHPPPWVERGVIQLRESRIQMLYTEAKHCDKELLASEFRHHFPMLNKNSPHTLFHFASWAIPDGDELGLVWLTEYHPWGSVRDILRQKKHVFCEEDIAAICYQIVRILSNRHHNDILSTGLTCGGVFLTPHGRVKLENPAITKPLIPRIVNLTHAMRPEDFCPSALFPELVNMQTVTPMLDTWRLGMLLLELAQGEGVHPLATLNHLRAVFACGNGTFLSRMIDPLESSSQLKSLIAECLRPNPDERPSLQQILQHPFMQQLHVEGLDLMTASQKRIQAIVSKLTPDSHLRFQPDCVLA
eukprot:TRINITY_DN6150_c0_g1_i8.p1 TRINITY_DN6150_c0_g1~~TRINITY_DN6150_c0_g1_i8.p1  ORF type:complete len:320 (-),score=26.53 TRINITY_DN6150_c0_g1_i8:178-1104(-)